VVLEQPGQFAWQIFDQKTKHLQRDVIPHPPDHQGDRQYHRGKLARSSKASKPMSHQDRREWNKAVRRTSVNPEREGRPPHEGLELNKSNWGETRSMHRQTKATP